MSIAAYFARIGLNAAPAPTAEGLALMLARHRQSIAFENFDVRLGRPIRIDSTSAFDKLVTRRRGGYCFEQNRLFADMMTQIGLPARPLLARVRLGMSADVTPVRSHVLLLTQIADAPWIVDAGFGGSFVPPLPLEDGAPVRTADGAAHRLRRIGARGEVAGEWLLERAGPAGATDGRASPGEGWQAQYTFDLSEVTPDDLEQCNHWTSTRPGTRFTSLHVASIVLPDGFVALTERAVSIHRAGAAGQAVEFQRMEDYAACLRDMFALDMSDAEVAALPLFA